MVLPQRHYIAASNSFASTIQPNSSRYVRPRVVRENMTRVFCRYLQPPSMIASTKPLKSLGLLPSQQQLSNDIIIITIESAHNHQVTSTTPRPPHNAWCHTPSPTTPSHAIIIHHGSTFPAAVSRYNDSPDSSVPRSGAFNHPALAFLDLTNF